MKCPECPSESDITYATKEQLKRHIEKCHKKAEEEDNY